VSEHNQIHFLCSPNFSHAITLLYHFFVGRPADLQELKMRKNFERKCYFLQKKYLDKHYREMLKLFYNIGADSNLKHVFLTSIPKELSQMVERAFLNKQRRI